MAKNEAPRTAAERAHDADVVAWAVSKGLRVLGGVDAGHVEAYDDETRRLAELARTE